MTRYRIILAEVILFAATPCRIPVLKQASLFACMTGLRISDILKLQWSDFEMGPDQGYNIRICTEKTETEATKNVTTTQIYADLVNSKKRETANKITLK